MTVLDYLDFYLEIGCKQGTDYPVTLRNSPAGQAHEFMRSPLENAAMITALQEPLPRKGIGSNMQVWGIALFGSLFTGSIYSCYRTSRLEAWKAGKRLRLRLSILAPDLVRLPWEHLYDPEQDEHLALSNWISFVRFIELPQPVTPLRVTPPLQVLGVVGGHADRIPGVQSEIRRIEAGTKVLRDKDLLRITWFEGKTWRELQRALRRQPWHILHYTGHGRYDTNLDEGAILLANDHGDVTPLRSGEMGRLLANHPTLRLVFLNASQTAYGSERDAFSGMAATIVRRGVPAVIGMQLPVSDLAAVEMASTFYEALADGYPVDAALSEARIAVSLSYPDSHEWSAPVLYLQAPDGVLFTVEKPERTPFTQEQVPIDPQVPDHTSMPTTLPRSTSLTPAKRRHLETQRDELLGQYQILSRRIEALDTDIGRELDSERKLILKERRAEALAERDQIATDIARIEQQLAEFSAAPSLNTAHSTAQTASSTATGLLPDERASLERRLTESRENLRLIEERKSQFVQETDIPLQLVKDERQVRDRITELEARLARP